MYYVANKPRGLDRSDDVLGQTIDFIIFIWTTAIQRSWSSENTST